MKVNISEDWCACDLSDLIAVIESGQRPYGGVTEESGEIPSLGGENIRQDGGITLHVLKKVPTEFYRSMAKGILQSQDVLINKDGANTGKIGIYSGELPIATINEHLFLLRGKPDYLVQQFLYRILVSEHGQRTIRSKISGSAQPGLKSDFIHHFPVFIPKSTTEQSRIAAVLDTVDAAIGQTEAIIAKLKQVRAGLLHDLLTRGLDEHGQLRPPPVEAPHLYQDSPLGKIPREWEILAVGQLFEMQLGKMLSPKAKTGIDSRPYVGNRHVLWERVDYSELEYMDFSPAERQKFLLRAGDLLICEGGEVGRTAIWQGEIEECYFQKAIHRLRPRSDHILSSYMLEFMKRAAQLGAFTNLTSQTSIAHLTQEKLALLHVAVPQQEEQKRMELIWQLLNDQQKGEEAEMAKLQHLKSALMSDLLTGRVRVPEGVEA